MSARPNSKRDRGFEKIAARLDLMHRQPDAPAANATATDFHGANAAQLRRRYIAEYAPDFSDRAALASGQALVDVFTAAWDAAHQRTVGRPEIGPMVNVRMPQSLIDRLDAAAAARGLSRAELVRQVLSEHEPGLEEA